MRAWAALGFSGSLLIALAGPRAVADAASPWWYQPSLGGKAVSIALVYAGVAVLCVAWVGLGRHASGEGSRRLLAIAALWLAPLALGPALFSRDAYSYLAQGAVLHIGANPYHTSPDALASTAYAPLLAAVSPFWHHTTAPYGPLFLGIMSVIVGVTGNHLVAGVLLTRLIELAGVAVLALQIPRLARVLGADPGRAVWLAVLNPLVALELVAAAHNDILMAALLAAGALAALRGRPVSGIALCALAATFKLPALAGAVFIATAWAREERGAAAIARFLAAAVGSVAAVFTAVSVVTGVGASWLSASLFSTPARVHLAITPSTQIGYTFASVAHGVGLGVSTHGAEAAVSAVTLAVCALLGLVLAVRVRVRTMALFTGGLLIAAAALGPAAWPWYFCWGLPLLVVCPPAQRLSALWIGSVLAVLVIKPNGILALPQSSAPAVLIVYAGLAGVWLAARRGGAGPGLAARTHSALIGT